MSPSTPSLSLLRRGWARGLDLRALAESALDSGADELVDHEKTGDFPRETPGQAVLTEDEREVPG